MIKWYAVYSKNNVVFHRFLVFICLVVFVFSSYQLLETENLVYIIPIFSMSFPIVLFSMSSDYKRKYIVD